MSWEEEWKELGVIDQGGQGVITKLESKNKPGKYAVVKTILDRWKNESQARERMNTEIKALEKLHAAGAMVPEVYSSFDCLDKSSDPFFVMEYIPGVSFKTWLETSAPVDVETAVKITNIIAGTIELCHENEVAHRDLKPANIIFKDDDLEKPYVLDFGISFDSMQNVTLTKKGETFRNEFISLPEGNDQIGAHQEKRSDITALVGIFFTCICAEMPRLLIDSNGQLPHIRHTDLISNNVINSEQRQQVKWFFDKGFKYLIAERFQTMQEFRHELTLLVDSSENEDFDFNHTFKMYEESLHEKDRNLQLQKLNAINGKMCENILQSITKKLEVIKSHGGAFSKTILNNGNIGIMSLDSKERGDSLDSSKIHVYMIKRAGADNVIHAFMKIYVVGMELHYYAFAFSGILSDLSSDREKNKAKFKKIATLIDINNSKAIEDTQKVISDVIMKLMMRVMRKSYRG